MMPHSKVRAKDVFGGGDASEQIVEVIKGLGGWIRD